MLLLADLNVARQELWARNKEAVKELNKELNFLEKKLQELVERKSALLENYHAGVIDKEGFRALQSNLSKEIEAVKKEFTKKKEEVQKASKEGDLSARDFQKLLCYTGEKDLIREMAEAFIKRIEIDEDNHIDIYWTFNNLTDHSNVETTT